MMKDRTAAAAGATRAVLLALTLASVAASCASQRGRVLSLGSRKYDVISCPGALENDVRCDEGYFPVGRFDDGVVCSDDDAPERYAEARDVCKLLPHGCTCTKSDAFCHPPLNYRERMLEHGQPPRRRCAADDPECGPIAASGACLGAAGYDPRAPRHLAASQRYAEGTCDADGDCMSEGMDCTDECVSYLLVEEVRENAMCGGLVSVPPPPDARFCGCVEKHCLWFHQ